MGPRITIDSATLMNKGFEVIEACWLFDFEPADVEVVVHPQSTVHAMVEFRGRERDRPGQYDRHAHADPVRADVSRAGRCPGSAAGLDAEPDTGSFSRRTSKNFRCCGWLTRPRRRGDSSTCTLNAADEVAVEAFLNEQIPFTGIAEVVAETLSRVPGRTPPTVAEVLEIDKESRAAARECVRQRAAVQA